MKAQLAYRQTFDINKFSTTFNECLLQLGGQSNFENLMETLEDILKTQFGVNFSFFVGISTWAGLVKPLENQLFTNSQIDRKVLEEIFAALAIFPEKQIVFDTNQVLQVGEAGFHFRFLTDGKQAIGAFFWLHGTMQSETNIHLMDLVLSAAQHFSTWCSRLQNSQELLYRDDLTNLYNYRYLDICLDNEIRRVQRFQSSFSLLFIDLDSFKPVNDSYGHLVGSNVLRQLAQLLQIELRDVDSIFRYGGDEFVILLIEADPKKALRVADRIRARIAGHHFKVSEQNTIHLTSSIGVACCPEHSIEKERLLQLADECMYKSKRNGKNKVAIVSALNV